MVHSNGDEMERAAALDTYLASLLNGDPLQIPDAISPTDLPAYLLATELASSRLDGSAHSAAISRLQARLRATPPSDQRTQPPPNPALPSRRQALLTAGGMAAGILVGVALDHAIPGLETPHRTSLVGDQGRWYAITSLSSLPPGSVRRFSAGGVDGYLINDGTRIRALSAICTHMGCHVSWRSARQRFECLCHGAAFTREGRVAHGIPPAPLPKIEVRVAGEQILAWGTHATEWG